ncbi:MAG: phosphate uptake regulator PhoU [Nitrososphaeraceae archaeon]
MSRSERRLQRIGSSMLISLPVDWIKTHTLKKGDVVSVETNNDNSISIFPTDTRRETPKEVTILLPGLSTEKLLNQIYGSYLLGYDLIQIKGISPINYETREQIKSVIRKLVGLEIVDEDSFKITVQFLLDSHSMEVSKILKRMSSLIGGMHRDTISSLLKNNDTLGDLIRKRDDEVDRQYFLIVRLMRSAMMDRKLASSLNLTNIDLLDYRIAANHLESAGDHICSLASFLSSFQVDDHIAELIQNANLIIFKMHEQSVKGFIERNIDASLQVIGLYSKFNEILKLISHEYVDRKISSHKFVVSTINATSTMDKIARSWVDIADLVKPVYLME